MARLTKQTVLEAKALSFQQGFDAGKAEATRLHQAQLKETQQMVLRLEGCIFLAKALYEQLRLAGVPEYITRHH